VPCFKAALLITTCSSNDISCLCSDAHFFTAVTACNAGNCTVVETLSNHTALVVTDHKHIEHDLTLLHREHERNLCGVWRSVRNQTDVLTGTTASFGAMALLMVIMRLLDRGISAQAKLGWDDLLIGLAGYETSLALRLRSHADSFRFAVIVCRPECSCHRWYVTQA
jgi:hypothetical protein